MTSGISTEELSRIDSALRVQLDILRTSAKVEADILRLLEKMRKELISKLAQADLTDWGKVRLNQLLRDSEALIASYYTQAQAVLSPTYATVSSITAGQAVTTIAATASMPTKAVLNSLVSNLLIEGSPAKAWWSKIASDTSFRFAAAVRQGIAQGETQNQIFKRVNETVQMAGRNSKALVHTSVMQVMNDATMATLQANADVAPTTRFLATLDRHTCPRCAPLDGLEWDTATFEPVGHEIPFTPPPIHFSCRCTLVGVTRLMKRADEIGIGQRASSIGPVKGSTTFAEFLERQPKEWQEDVMGKGRAELYHAKKLTLQDLVSGNGSPLTLKQLEAKYG